MENINQNLLSYGGFVCTPSEGQWNSKHDIDCKFADGNLVTFCKACGKILDIIQPSEIHIVGKNRDNN